ncbi:MAG TPA: 5-deoxy-glucuronate isomerase [Acidimicrobiales bacterium]|nr:5-deoxy-glucuronate isomerase [Acidimicrobiales bacterium]
MASRTATHANLHMPAGSTARPPWELHLTRARAGWSWASLRILFLSPSQSHAFSTGDEELLVVPLAGSCAVTCGGEETSLRGRRDVFSGHADCCYLPPGADATVSSRTGGRFAVAGARARLAHPFRTRRAQEISVELRGAGNCSRRIVNYCMPGDFDADHLMVCEAFTPAGNWSSYPPHKHDEIRHGETALEEIYYFEIAHGPDGDSDRDGVGVAYQRVYGTEARPLDLLAEVRDGDVVLVPHGYHGPSMAAPGYDLYYLNVMAGPGERRWLVTDDPDHAWIRATWAGAPVDPRLVGTPPSG